MEERIIKIDINTAKEWYKEGGFRKELALKAFKKEELQFSYKNIKTFEDAYKTLGLSEKTINSRINNLKEYYHSTNLIAQYKLNIIREVLNNGWNPQLNEGEIYYSWIYWYPINVISSDIFYENIHTLGKFINLSDNKKYILVAIDNDYAYTDTGLGLFKENSGFNTANISLLGCKSKEIALHLVKYFGKIIFDAIYGQYNNYKWIE